MIKLLSILGSLSMVGSGAAAAVAPARETSTLNNISEALTSDENIEYSGAKGNWDYQGDHGGDGTPFAGLNDDKNAYVMANALGGNNNNSYAHELLTIDYLQYASGWDDFTSKYSKFAFTGETTIWGDYERNHYDGHVINNNISPDNEGKEALLDTTLIGTYGNSGFLNQESVGNGSLPTIDTKGWSDWWRGSGKKKIAQSQAWGGATAISFWHDGKKIYINIAADFRNDRGTFTANGKSELILKDITFIKNA